MRRTVSAMLLTLLPLAAVADCRPGAAVEIRYGGQWFPGKVKDGPDAEGRCFVSYDGYGDVWDSWMAPADLRLPGAPAAAAPAAAASTTPLPTDFVPKRDRCTEGERVMTRQRQAGTVSSVGAIGACFIDLDSGGSIAAQAEDLHPLSNNQGLVQGEPPLTVYDCHSPEIPLRADVMFSLRPGDRYRHFDGGGGRYTYDTATATLRMHDGPLQGQAYFRFGEQAFSLLQDGTPSNVSCVSNVRKDADTPPW